MTTERLTRLASLARQSDLDLIEDQLYRDQAQSWSIGECLRVEDYLGAIPVLADQRRLIRRLIQEEARLQKKHGQPPVKSDYLKRFPAFAEYIEDLFEDLEEDAIEGNQETLHGTIDTSRVIAKPDRDPRAQSTEIPATGNPSTVADLVGRSLGPYRILAKLGQGGMGAVFKACHVHLDKVVALKILPPQFVQDAECVARFRREMRAVGKVSHPNVVQAFDAGEIGGMHFLTMEFSEGKDLKEFVRDHGTCSVNEAHQLIRQAGLGLAAAHAEGVIHRDVKPSNFLRTSKGCLKLLDLGLARLAEANRNGEMTATGQVFGTPDFMAPEQWDDARTADARTDLYALGCTLFYLLTGRGPYDDLRHKTTLAKMTGHLQELAPDLKVARGDVPDSLLAIYQKLMAKSPDRRYQSADELVADLDNVQTNHTAPVTPIVPRADTESRPVNRAKARLLVAAGTAAVAIVALLTTMSSRSGDWFQNYGPEAPAGINEPGLTTSDKSVPNSRGTPAALKSPVTGAITGKEAGVRRTVGIANSVEAESPSPPTKPSSTPAIEPFASARAGDLRTIVLPNQVALDTVWCPTGSFQMGSADNDTDATFSEKPQQLVRLTSGFWIGKTEVTQAQWASVLGTTPWKGKAYGYDGYDGKAAEGANLPATFVTWNDGQQSGDSVQSFCAQLTEMQRRSGNIPPFWEVRLPTEAEWEYACRAGTDTKFDFGNSTSDLAAYANIGKDKDRHGSPLLHSVATHRPNRWGLHDMLGNVEEICLDAFGPLPGGADPLCESGFDRAIRGGSVFFNLNRLRPAMRSVGDRPNQDLGFRIVVGPTKPVPLLSPWPNVTAVARTMSPDQVTLTSQSWEKINSAIVAERGKPVAVLIWSLSAPPSRDELTEFVRLQEELRDQATLMTISTDYAGIKSKPPSYYEPRVREFLAGKGARTRNFLCTTDAEVVGEALEKDFGGATWPSTIVYDREGRLLQVTKGFQRSIFDLEVRGLLKLLVSRGGS